MAIGTPNDLFGGTPISSVTNNATVAGSTSVAGTAGSLIIAVATSRDGTPPTTCTFTDSVGLTWTTVVQTQVAGSGMVAIGWALDSSGIASGTTITATFDNSGTRKGLSAFSVTGLDTTTPVDSGVTANANASTGTPSVTAAGASAQADTLFVGVSRHNTSATTDSGTIGGTGWTEYADFTVGTSTILQHYVGYKIAAATETATFTFTPTVTSTNWQASIVGFKAAASGGTTFNVSANASVATVSVVVRQGQLTQADSVATVAAPQRATTLHTISDSVATTAAAVRSTTLNTISDSVATTAAVVRQGQFALSDSVATVAGIIRQGQLVLSDSVATVAGVVRQGLLTLADAVATVAGDVVEFMSGAGTTYMVSASASVGVTA